MEEGRDNLITTLLPELEADILSRLPPKKLLSLKCLSKWWNVEISSSSFSKLHRERQKVVDASSSDCGSFMIMMNELSAFYFDLHSNIIKELPPPPNLSRGHFICSYGGLILFSERSPTPGVCALYNPLTGAYAQLSPLIIDVADHPGPNFVMHDVHVPVPRMGFGYDSVSNDYKILWILQYDEIEGNFWDRHEVAYIYSTKMQSWKLIKPYPPRQLMVGYKGEPPTIACCNNSFHWISSRLGRLQQDISALNLGTGEYSLLPKPDSPYPDFKRSMDLVVLKGCLHLITDNPITETYDVWLMREYGVQHSWTKLFHYDPFAELSPRNFWDIRPLPYGYSADGQEILVGAERSPRTFFYYNLRTRERRKVELNNTRLDFRRSYGYSVVPWVPSLLSLAACS